MINTIVFDLGGVLIDWDPEYLYRKLIPSPDRRRYFLENICTPAWNEQQDAGRSLEEATQALLAQFPEWESEIKAYYGRWQEMLGGPIHQSVELLRDLKQSGKYRLLALTNWSAETFPVALELYDFLHWFEGIVVSGVEKTRKPYTEIYRILIDRHQVIPRQALFIDDKLTNVETATMLGLQVIHFKSPSQLTNVLRKMGILT